MTQASNHLIYNYFGWGKISIGKHALCFISSPIFIILGSQELCCPPTCKSWISDTVIRLYHSNIGSTRATLCLARYWSQCWWLIVLQGHVRPFQHRTRFVHAWRHRGLDLCLSSRIWCKDAINHWCEEGEGPRIGAFSAWSASLLGMHIQAGYCASGPKLRLGWTKLFPSSKKYENLWTYQVKCKFPYGTFSLP